MIATGLVCGWVLPRGSAIARPPRHRSSDEALAEALPAPKVVRAVFPTAGGAALKAAPDEDEAPARSPSSEVVLTDAPRHHHAERLRAVPDED